MREVSVRRAGGGRGRGARTWANASTSFTSGVSGSGKSSAVNGSCFGFGPDAVGWSLNSTSGSRGTGVKPYISHSSGMALGVCSLETDAKIRSWSGHEKPKAQLLYLGD